MLGVSRNKVLHRGLRMQYFTSDDNQLIRYLGKETKLDLLKRLGDNERRLGCTRVQSLSHVDDA